jgi:hypothetical protein
MLRGVIIPDVQSFDFWCFVIDFQMLLWLNFDISLSHVCFEMHVAHIVIYFCFDFYQQEV